MNQPSSACGCHVMLSNLPGMVKCRCATSQTATGSARAPEERWTVFAFDGSEPPSTDLRRDVPYYDLLVTFARAAAQYPSVLVQRTG